MIKIRLILRGDLPATASTATVSVDSKGDALLDKFNGLVLGHSFFIVGIHESVKVSASRSSNTSWLTDQSTANGNLKKVESNE